QALGVGAQEFHGQVDAIELAVVDGQVAAVGGAGTQHHGIAGRAQFLNAQGVGASAANIGVGHKVDAFGGEQIDAALHHILAQLHIGNAVHQQAADAIGALVHGD